MTAFCGRPKTNGEPCRAITDGGPCRQHSPDAMRARRSAPPKHMPGCKATLEPDWGRPVDALCLGPAGHLVEFVCIGCGSTSTWHLADDTPHTGATS